jgi:hypothetical protein
MEESWPVSLVVHVAKELPVHVLEKGVATHPVQAFSVG